MSEQPLDLHDIQGLLVRGYGPLTAAQFLVLVPVVLLLVTILGATLSYPL